MFVSKPLFLRRVKMVPNLHVCPQIAGEDLQENNDKCIVTSTFPRRAARKLVTNYSGFRDCLQFKPVTTSRSWILFVSLCAIWVCTAN